MRIRDAWRARGGLFPTLEIVSLGGSCDLLIPLVWAVRFAVVASVDGFGRGWKTNQKSRSSSTMAVGGVLWAVFKTYGWTEGHGFWILRLFLSMVTRHDLD